LDVAVGAVDVQTEVEDRVRQSCAAELQIVSPSTEVSWTVTEMNGQLTKPVVKPIGGDCRASPEGCVCGLKSFATVLPSELAWPNREEVD
jgi:hypothetical protein